MKYKLLKDLPGVEAGTIIHKDKNGVMRNEDGVRFSKEMSDIMDEILDNSKWFEPVEEKKSMAERIWEQLPAPRYGTTAAVLQQALTAADIVDAPREEDITGEMAEKAYRFYDKLIMDSDNHTSWEDFKDAMKFIARMWREKRGQHE